MIIEVILFFIGLVLLVKGSGFFVRSAASIAKKLGISDFIIGLTLIAIGTSLPELVSAIFASIKHESGLITGNILGANIANIGLVVGIAAIVAVIKTKKEMVERDGYLLLFLSVVLFVFFFDKKLSRIEGTILFILYVSYIIFLIETKPKFKKKYDFRNFVTYFFKFKYLITIRSKLISNLNKNKINLRNEKKTKIWKQFKAAFIKDSLILIFGGFMIIFGAKYLVENAVFFANLFEIPQVIIGVLIAIGTTIPEMSVAITAVKKGYGNIVIGNAIGSCITNILLILGIASFISPLTILKLSIHYIVPFMIFMILLLLFFIKSHWEIRRIEGIIFFILYLIFITFLLFNV